MIASPGYAIAKRLAWTALRSLIAIAKWTRKKIGTSIAGTKAQGKVVIASVPGPSVKTRNGVPGAENTRRVQ